MRKNKVFYNSLIYSLYKPKPKEHEYYIMMSLTHIKGLLKTIATSANLSHL